MLLDANILLYAYNQSDARHEQVARWLESVLNSPTRVGLPWQSLNAFLRLATNPRLYDAPATPEAACAQVHEWLAAPAAWIPLPTPRHADVLTTLIERYRLTGPLISDAELAALAIEHGIPVASTDADFARFRELRWENPLN
jgi:toxin-antitoxin system PIN domain toxin